MKKGIVKQNLMNFVLILSLGSLTLSQPCGVIEMFSNEKNLDQSDFLVLKEDLGDDKNGNSLSFWGWMKLEEDEDKDNYPLFRLAVKPNQGEENVSEVLGNIASASYDNSGENGQLTWNFAKNNGEIDERIVEVDLPIGEWLFLGYSMDADTNKANLNISGKNVNLNEKAELDFKDLFFRKNFELDLGCIPMEVDDGNREEVLASCSMMKVRDFNYMLEGFESADKLKNLNAGVYDSDTYTMDFYKDTPSIGMNSKNSNKSIKFEGKSYFLEKGENFKAFKGKNSATLNSPDIDENEFINSPSFYTVFKYNEDLPDDFLLLKNMDGDNKSNYEIRLKKKTGGKRSVQVNFPEKDISYETTGILEPNKIQKVQINLVQDPNFMQIWVKHGNNIMSSEQFVNKNALEDGSLRLFEKTNSGYPGEFVLYQMNVIENSSGAVYDIIRRPKSRTNDKCNDGCDIYSKIGYQNRECIECGDGKLLEPSTGKCQDSCGLGKKNVEGRCYDCKDDKCTELKQTYFKADKIDDNNYEIKQIKDIPDFDGDVAKVYDLEIPGLEKDKQYTAKVESFPEEKRAVYNMTFPNEAKLANKNLMFNLKPDALLIDKNKNRIQNQDFKFPLEEKILPIDAKAVDPLEPAQKIIVVSPSGRIEKRDSDVEKRFKRWGIATFFIFLVGILFGLIGLFYRCPYLNDFTFYDFYFQKFVQTVLMWQYLAFWVLYNCYFPYNLLNFMHYFYKYSIGWHKIFRKAAENNHEGDPDFDNNWLNKEHWRFYEEDVYNHFVISFGLIFLIQGFFLLLFLIVKLIYSSKCSAVDSQNYNNLTDQEKYDAMESKRYWKKINDHFDMKILMTIFLIFIIETLVFAVYNYHHHSWEFATHLFRFSLAMAIIWTVIVVLLWIKNIIVPMKDNAILQSDSYNDRWGFVYTGLVLNMPRKIFQGFQYFHYGFFAVILVVVFDKRSAQSIINLVALIVLFLFVLTLMPANTTFWKVEQILVHLFLLVAKILLTILVVDDSRDNLSANTRWRLGYAIAFFIFFVILWNTLVLIWKLLEHMIKCSKAKASGVGRVDKLNEDEDYEKMFWKQDSKGGYKTVQRPDLYTSNKLVEVKEGAPVDDDSVPSYYKTEIKEKKEHFYEEINKPVQHIMTETVRVNQPQNVFIKNAQPQNVIIKDAQPKNIIIKDAQPVRQFQKIIINPDDEAKRFVQPLKDKIITQKIINNPVVANRGKIITQRIITNTIENPDSVDLRHAPKNLITEETKKIITKTTTVQPVNVVEKNLVEIKEQMKENPKDYEWQHFTKNK